MPNSFLTKFQTSTFYDGLPTSAVVSFYRPGATATSATTIPASSTDNPIDVGDSGNLELGDTITAGPGGGSLVVQTIVSLTQIIVTNYGGASVPITEGMRLLLPYDRPTVFLERGSAREAVSEISVGPYGRGLGYVASDRFDYVVHPTGETATAYGDAPGGTYRSDVAWNDIRDFATIQDAIDALPEAGGVVYLPTGFYDVVGEDEEDGIVINKPNVTLMGDGLGTVIRPDSGDIDNFNLITVTADHFRICNLKLDGLATTQDFEHGHCGLVVDGDGQSVEGCTIENVQIQRTSCYGLWLKKTTGLLATQLESLLNKGHGARVEGAGSRAIRFIDCIFSYNGGKGIEAEETTGITWFGCGFEGNKLGNGSEEGNSVDAVDCPRLEIISCYFENAAPDDQPNQLVLIRNCRSAIVDGCWFQGQDIEDKPLRAVRFWTSPFSRLSNNAGENFEAEFAKFDNQCNESVEFCNDDRDYTIEHDPNLPSRIAIDDYTRMTGLSRGALSLPVYEEGGMLPNANTMREGSMVWVAFPEEGDSHLQVSDGTSWLQVTLT